MQIRVFPCTYLKRIDKATQSVMSSDVDITHVMTGSRGCKLSYRPHISEKWSEVLRNVLLSGCNYSVMSTGFADVI